MLNLDPVKGYEQKGFRPVVVVSNNVYNSHSNFRVVYPISNTKRKYSLYVPLDMRTKTTGTVLADQLRTIDITARKHRKVEQIPSDILDHLLEIAQATLER
jgi:mRNA interferase MazF